MKDCKKCVHWDALVSCKLKTEITEYIDSIDIDTEYTDLDCLSFTKGDRSPVRGEEKTEGD